MLNKNKYEEIADIPESISEGVVINGEEDIEENSIVELDFRDFEELGSVEAKSLKSMTIIDEFEKESGSGKIFEQKRNFTESRGSINIQELSRQIDSLNSVKKYKTEKKKAVRVIPEENPPEEIYTAEIRESEEQKGFIPIPEVQEYDVYKEKEDTLTKETFQEFSNQNKEIIDEQEDVFGGSFEAFDFDLKIPEVPQPDFNADLEKKTQNIPNEKAEPGVKDEDIFAEDFQEAVIRQFEEIIKEDRERQSQFNLSEKKSEEIGSNNDLRPEPENIPPALPVIPAIGQGNIFTIEIPDKLLEELPKDFNIDELGRIDLKEAEIIAEEDILTLANDEILDELEELDILPEKKEITDDKNKKVFSSQPVKTEKSKTENKSEHIKTKESDDVSENVKAADIKKKEEIIAEKPPEHEFIAESEDQPGITEKKVEVEVEEKLILTEEEKIDNTDQQKADTPPKEDIAEVIQSPVLQKDVQIIQPDTIHQNNDRNVLFLDSEKINTDTNAVINQLDELDNISFSVADAVNREIKLLAESEAKDKKLITGLIRDNYPAFRDLLKEKENDEQHVHFDEDIDFVQKTFLKNVHPDRLIQSEKPSENVVQTKSMPYEQILGLIPDEIDLIENQLFRIKSRKADPAKTKSEIFFDQHPDDIVELEKYKYILPTPNSLLDDEKKSIEDEILAKSALIFEEDVDKIKEKLEDSMEKKIKETIQDITGKITIYEDNKNHNKTENIETEKEDIKRLLKYLDELLENLPEQTINKFAESDYYELYKKVLKNLDI